MSKAFRAALVVLLGFWFSGAFAAVPLQNEYRMNTAACMGVVRYSDWAPFPAGISNYAGIASCKTSDTNTRSVSLVSCSSAALTCTFTITDTPTSGGSPSVRTSTFGPDESRVVCPANSIKSDSSCVCAAGFDEKNGQCVPPSKSCKFGNTSSAGYYDAGKNTDGGPSIMTCTGGCESIFDGSFPEGSSLVNGEKHYYAKGEYIQTGRECTGSAESIGQGIPVTEIPPDSCGAGQVMGKVNGKSVCSKSGADGAPTTKPDDKKDQSSTTKTTTKDKDSEGNDRETTTVVKKNADGSTTTETTTTVTKSNGSGGTTSTTTTNTVTTGGVSGSGGKGESGGKEDGEEDGDKEKGKCEKNSSDEGCGGAAANVDGKTFYMAKEKTFSGVLTKASTDLRGSGIGGAFTGFFNVASGGACPVSQWHIPYIDANVSFDVMCQPFALNAMLIIKGVLLVIASVMAFRIAFE